MFYRHTTTKAFRNCICTIGCKRYDIQHVYKLSIGIDLINDNQYWTVLINSATRECSTNLIHRAHLIWSNKNTTPIMELQNFLWTTSYTCRVPLWWFKTYSTLRTNKKILGSNFSCNLLSKLHGSCTNYHFIQK